MACRNGKGRRDQILIRSRPATNSLVIPSAIMNTGTAIKYEIGAGSCATSFGGEDHHITGDMRSKMLRPNRDLLQSARSKLDTLSLNSALAIACCHLGELRYR
jgi:hypothetical protein